MQDKDLARSGFEEINALAGAFLVGFLAALWWRLDHHQPFDAVRWLERMKRTADPHVRLGWCFELLS